VKKFNQARVNGGDSASFDYVCKHMVGVSSEASAESLFEAVMMASRRKKSKAKVEIEDQVESSEDIRKISDNISDEFIEKLDTVSSVVLNGNSDFGDVGRVSNASPLLFAEMDNVGPTEETRIWLDARVKPLDEVKNVDFVCCGLPFQCSTFKSVDIRDKNTLDRNFFLDHPSLLDQTLFTHKIPRVDITSLRRINFDYEWFALDVGIGIDCYVWQQFGSYRVLTEYGQTFTFQTSFGVPQFVARATLSRIADNLEFEFYDMINSSRILDCGYALRWFILNEWLKPFLKYQSLLVTQRFFCSFSGVSGVSVTFKIARPVTLDFESYSFGTSGKIIFFREDAKLKESDSSKNFFFVSGNLIEVTVSKGEMYPCYGKMASMGNSFLDVGRYLIFEYRYTIYPLCKALSLSSGSLMDKLMTQRHRDTFLKDWSILEKYLVLYFQIQFLIKRYRKRGVVINHDAKKKRRNKRNKD